MLNGSEYHDYTNYTQAPSFSNISIENEAVLNELEFLRLIYPYLTVTMILFCAFSVAINIIVLCSACWIRRPLSPTLHISLSLAGSDMYTSFVMGIGIVFNSLLPIVYEVDAEPCVMLFMEALRMGGMYTMIGHLLALAGNHYLGIRKPLHYPSIMTNRNITVISVILWLSPASGFLVYFRVLDNDGFNHSNCTSKFLNRAHFRRMCSYFFLGCLLLMAAIYSHIYLLVRRHQANRNRFRRIGSTYSRNSQANDNNQIRNHNEKALRTTLLIVGSVILGWFPATLYFYLVCEDCPIPPNWGTRTIRVIVKFVNNTLIILKTAVNSYIYAARMHEIKTAMKKMRYSLVLKCCQSGTATEVTGHCSDGSRHYYSRSSTRRSKRSVLCRLQSFPRSNRAVPEQYSTPL